MANKFAVTRIILGLLYRFHHARGWGDASFAVPIPLFPSDASLYGDDNAKARGMDRVCDVTPLLVST